MRPSKASTTLAFLLLVCAILLSFYSLRPYGDATANTEALAVDIKAVQGHVQKMCSKRHFTGTGSHTEVLNYLVRQLELMGLETEVQQTMAITPKWRAAVQVHNVIARIKGTNPNRKALVLLSHYDSAPSSSKGASDDGSGVAVILEVVKKYLEKKIKAENDIIILLTDAEELGLLGARAFVNQHPWIKDVGLVLNFEARGSGGPSYMLVETNTGNSRMVRAFNRAASARPVASSLMYSIYKMLPNDMDMTVFREEADKMGFDFAFIGDHFDYHTAQDKPERLDKATLLQQMDYLSATLLHFKDEDLSALRSDEDAVFFNIPFCGLFIYPFSWVWPMGILALVLLLAFLIIGVRQGKIKPLNVLYSFVVYLSLLIIVGLITWLFWKFMLLIHPHYSDILQGFTYNGYAYIGVVVFMSIGMWGICYQYLLMRKTAYESVSGPLIIWVLINLLIAGYLKGAGYFVVPLLFSLTGLILALLIKVGNSVKYWIVSVSALPALVMLSPLVQMFAVGLGLKILFGIAVLTILLLGFVIPAAYYFRLKWLGVLTGVLFLLLLMRAEMTSGFDSTERKQPDGVAYVMDADHTKAWWVSMNRVLDEWSRKVLGDKILDGSPQELNFISKYKTNVRHYSEADVMNLPKPTISYQKNDTLYPGKTLYRLHYIPHRPVHKIMIVDRMGNSYTYLNVNGAALGQTSGEKEVLSTKNNSKLVEYFVTPGKEELNLEMIPSQKGVPDLQVYEMSFDLSQNPLFELPAKPDNVMPMPFVNNDAIIVLYKVKL